MGLLFIGLLAPGANAQVSDTLKIGHVVGDTGQTVTVAVALTNPVHVIQGFELELTYNRTYLHAVSFSIRATGRAQLFELNNSIHLDTIRVTGAAYSPDPDTSIATGSGDFVLIDFIIDHDAHQGDYPIRFALRNSSNPTFNTLSSVDAQLLYPILVDGFIRVNNGVPNTTPVFNPALVSPRQVDVGSQLQFIVRATDADGDNISLSGTNLPSGATFASANGQGEVSSTFSFTPTTSQGNQTFHAIFIASDGFIDIRDTVVINTVIPGSNNPPVISAPSSREVAEGGHLEFIVSATDADGDNITLAATNLPANASFPGNNGTGSVSSTFSFDPDYDQGGNTYNVYFTASDGEGGSAQQTVSIIVLESPNDILEIATKQGALPGSIGRSLIVNMRNHLPVYALQFDLLFDPTILEIKDVVADSARAFDFLLFQNLIDDGRYRVGILPMSLDTIPTGGGKIVEFIVDVDQDAPVGASVVTFDSATTVQDTAGTSVEMLFDEGTWTIDLLGDANLDGYLSLGDCVAVLANVIGRLELTIRAADAGDFNRDAEVRISDLQGITFTIFGLTSDSPVFFGKAGTVELVREDITPGYNGEIPVWLDINTEAAAVQFTIDYDPEQVAINDVLPGEMVSDLNLEYTDNGHQIKGAVYTFNLTKFGPSIGELVRLDVDFISNDIDPSTAVRLTDFEIVTVDAHILDVDILGELPESFTLYQNYPNPFNAQTAISFDMASGSMAVVSVYNVLGQMVTRLHEGYLEAGVHQLIWDGKNANGSNVTSGVYFYRLEAENFDKTKKMLLVK